MRVCVIAKMCMFVRECVRVYVSAQRYKAKLEAETVVKMAMRTPADMWMEIKKNIGGHLGAQPTANKVTKVRETKTMRIKAEANSNLGNRIKMEKKLATERRRWRRQGRTLRIWLRRRRCRSRCTLGRQQNRSRSRNPEIAIGIKPGNIRKMQSKPKMKLKT